MRFGDNPSKMQKEILSSFMDLPQAPQRHIRLGLIGLGWVTRNCHLPSLRVLQGEGWPLGIARLCDRDLPKLQTTSAEWPDAIIEGDPTELLARDDLDGVMILTRPEVSAPLLRCAIKRGHTIFVEKPVAHSRREIEDCLNLAGRNGARIQVGYNRRHQPLAAAFERFLTQLSPPCHVKVQFWRAGRNEPGFFDDTLVHCLDFLSHLIGPLQVKDVCTWQMKRPSKALDRGWRIDLASRDKHITAEVDIRPSVGRDLETYEILGDKLSATLHYPHFVEVDGRAALIVYRNGCEQVLYESAVSPGDINGRCIHSGFVGQLAEFALLCSDQRRKPTCDLAAAMEAVRLRDEIAVMRQTSPDLSAD